MSGLEARTPGAGWIRRQRSASARTLAAAVTLAVAGLTLAQPASAAQPESAAGRYLVRTSAGHLGALTHDLAARGIKVQRQLAIMDTDVAVLSAAQAAALRSDPLVVALTQDGSVTLAGNKYDAESDTNSAYNADDVLGAHTAWDRGITGAGVDVALIDSGVSPVAGLDNAGQIIKGPDLSFDSENTNIDGRDTYGHGTAMAGLIGAHDSNAAADSTDANNYQGVAPNVRIVSVKVADSLGRTDVSQVIAGIDWVVQNAHSNGMNIRVLNLSFGTDSKQSYVRDPLAYATEIAWRNGIVVVASAGNGGGTKLMMPAADPFLIAVGAIDSQDTADNSDDKVARFSNKGTRSRQVDLLAPGVHLQSLRVPGSYLDSLMHKRGSAGIDARFFRGSGTSQAAALTSGAVALLLEARPELTPDQVKALLHNTGYSVTEADGNWDAYATGVDVGSAIDGWVGRARQRFIRAIGGGSIALSRGSVQLPKHGTQLSGEVDVFGRPLDTARLASDETNLHAWDGNAWNGAGWAGAGWAGAGWAGAGWAGDDWQGVEWTGAGWAGAGWAGAGWAGAGWAGAGWAGAGWASQDFS